MASYGITTTATHRPSAATTPPPLPQVNKLNNSSRKGPYTFSFSFPFDIPPSPESAAVRIVKNLEKFSLYYAIFVWTVLFITLIPERKVSVVYLVATTEVAFLYILLLRDCVLLHRIIDRRLVLFVLFFITAVEMILTRAAVHLFVVLAVTLPIVVVHAVLMRREDVAVHEEAGDTGLLVEETLGGVAAQSESLV